MIILGRGSAGKSALSLQLSDGTDIPELDALFWQPGPAPMDPPRVGRVRALAGPARPLDHDGDLGPYDTALKVRLRAADAIVGLNCPFLRCAWRPLRRGREHAEYWPWCGPTAVAAFRMSCGSSAPKRPTPSYTS